ncbi:MAG: carboxypeptidase regulatory-like domain-containing protein [Acidobacteriota bacterium]
MRKLILGCVVLALLAAPAIAQQTGTIIGKVTMDDGAALPGVLVTATSNVLPQARTVSSGGNGDFRLPVLPPGTYELTFTLAGMATEKAAAAVALQQTTVVNMVMKVAAVAEQIEVTAEASLVDPTSAELKAAVEAEVITGLPVGQEYRDLVKLIPGVQYSEDSVRGPSAGGSGQDNVYMFDGVNVNLPLFGTLSAEPASHDIDQFAVVKGGASATDFNRAAGFMVNSVSKSGTNAFHGMVSYQIQPESFVAEEVETSTYTYDEDKDWITANLGGPILKDHLYFYGSFYRPTTTRENRATVYGPVPDYESTRDEYFGKLTFSPTQSLLLHGSYRKSETSNSHSAPTTTSSASVTSGSESELEITILEGSWVASQNSFLTFKYTDFANPTMGRPDTILDRVTSLETGRLDVNNLDTQGYLIVPVFGSNEQFNAFVAPIIDRYGYLQDGVRTGGGRVGGYFQFNNQDFYRENFQVGWDLLFGANVTHELHVGYQWFTDEEDLYRYSNGWGQIEVYGGTSNCPSGTGCDGLPFYYRTRVQQQGILDVPVIHSEFESQNIELNDSIKWGNLTLNVGVLISNDKLYGQGLRENSSNYSGFENDPTSKYLMHEVDWQEMIQPRLGAVWAYDASNTVYANFARYMPAASSLPRAASWARNLAAERFVYFDEDGEIMGWQQVASSSGKWFQDDLDPRATDEYLLGTTRDFGNGWSGRAHARYRYSYNFWEDTNNDARIRFEPPEGVPQELYVEDLAQIRAEIGGSTYVIAELDGAFTKFWEAGLEAEWRGRNAYFRGSYVWSQYYGNFDQDNSTGGSAANDDNIFIGSSNIADGAGRQIWDYKYGWLRGDRRHQLKLYGYYTLPWQGSVGAYAIYQSGQPWEYHSYEPYFVLSGGSRSDTNRYAEPAGSRRTDDHYQLDLNYTQDFRIADAFLIQARVDVYNVFDNQTGYDIQYNVHSANPGLPESFIRPRRFQVALRLEF